MKGVQLYAQVRFAVQIEGVSRREAARRYGIDPRTVAKMLVAPRRRQRPYCGRGLYYKEWVAGSIRRSSMSINAHVFFYYKSML